MAPAIETTGRQLEYMRVYSDLRFKLKSSKYPIGSFLPTEPELEQLYNVSRSTVRRAVALLVNEGLVRVTRGRGTEVVAALPYQKYLNIKSISTTIQDDSQPAKINSFITAQANIDTTTAKEATAAALGLEIGAPLYRLQRVVKTASDNRPAAFIVNFLPQDLVPDFQKYENTFTDLYPFLEETYGIKYLSSEEYISARAATILEANTLDVAVGSPLLYCKRIAQCDRGPLEYAYSTYVPELYKIKIKMDVNDYALV